MSKGFCRFTSYRQPMVYLVYFWGILGPAAGLLLVGRGDGLFSMAHDRPDSVSSVS